MEFNIKGKRYQIELSKDGNVHVKRQNGVYYYSLPEESMNEVIKKFKAMEAEELRKQKEYNNDIDKTLAAIFNNREQRKMTTDINVPQRTEAVNDRKLQSKRSIKKSIKPRKKKKYIGNKNLRVKALIATLVIVGTIGIGAYGANRYSQYQNEYQKVATSVENLTDDEIEQKIEDVIKQEVSQATGKEMDEIEISQYEVGSDTKRTEIQAGDNIYAEDINVRDPFSFGNTLKSKGISNIITQSRQAETRKELIKVLRKALKFSEQKDLRVDGNNLKEIESTKNGGDER